jgi:hypothetical protein
VYAGKCHVEDVGEVVDERIKPDSRCIKGECLVEAGGEKVDEGM